MTGCADAILAAVRRELESRRAHLDAANDVGEVTFTVRINAGTATVKGVVYQEERFYRQTRPERHGS